MNNKRKTKKKFKKFLEKHGATESYNNSADRAIAETYYKHNPTGILLGTFIWTDTPEGGKYWVALDKAWRKELGDREFYIPIV